MPINQTLQEKYPHLEISVLKLSEVQKDNESKRIDSEFLRKEDIKIKNILSSLQSEYLSKLISFNSRYSQPIYDDRSTLKVINSQYIRNEFIDYENAKTGYGAIVPKEAILINSTGVGTLGRVNINLLNCDFSIDSHINVLVVKDATKLIPSFLMIFLQTKYGQSQINRYYSGTSGQIEIYPKDFNNFLIPILPMPFQLEIEKMVKDSHKALEQSKALYKEAESLLYTELGLDPNNPMQSILCDFNASHYHTKHCKESNTDSTHRDISLVSQAQYDNISCQVKSQNVIARFDTVKSWQSTNKEILSSTKNAKNISLDSFNKNDKTPNFTIKTLKESFLKTGRLDSEYYQDKYEKNERVIKDYKNGFCNLQTLLMEYSSGFAFCSEEYLESGKLRLIRINNIKNGILDMSNSAYLKDEAENLSPKDKVAKNDILISMSGSIGLACVVREDIEAMINQRILKIRIQGFSVEVLTLYLNSIMAKLQFERIGTGGVQTNISSSDIFNILIPLVDITIQQEIEAKILQSFALRTKSKELLEQAKQMVEEAISKS